MDPLGRSPAESTVQHDVLGRGGEPLLSADDVGDPHQVIVDHIGQVVGGEAIGFQQNLIVNLGVFEAHLAAQTIHHDGLAGFRHSQADDKRLARGGPRVRDSRVQAATVPVVAHEVRLALLLGAQLVQSLGGAEAAVGRAGCDQVGDLASVNVSALGLAIGAVGAAHVGPFVPGKPYPAQGAQDGRLGLRRGARAIRVFDAQDELPAMALGEHVVEQGDVGGPHVGIAGWRRRNAHAYGHVGSLQLLVELRDQLVSDPVDGHDVARGSGVVL